MSYISKTPGVMGGSGCLRDPPPHLSLAPGEARANGATDARLLRDYPGLTQADLDAVWEDFARNRAGIMNDIPANRLAQSARQGGRGAL